MQTDAGGKAEQVGDSASLELVARAGLIAYGVVHLLIGWLAAQIAWSASESKSADTSGALKTLAAQPFGKVLLWLVAIGLVALALWQASEAIWGYRNREGAKRLATLLRFANPSQRPERSPPAPARHGFGDPRLTDPPGVPRDTARRDLSARPPGKHQRRPRCSYRRQCGVGRLVPLLVLRVWRR
jgi:Domain of Unknown Function (DUF1206)